MDNNYNPPTSNNGNNGQPVADVSKNAGTPANIPAATESPDDLIDADDD